MMIIINLKTYLNGRKVIKIAKLCRKKGILLATQATDIKQASKYCNVIAQHVDSCEPGKNTGYITVEAIKANNAIGCLINHYEHRLRFGEIKEIIKRCKRLRLKTIVCSASLRQIKKIIKLKPYAIAFEEPKLIGTGKPISVYKADGVKSFSKLLKKTKIMPLCGAGISNIEDIIKAKELGCKGVLIASMVVKAKDHKKIIKSLEKCK